MHNWEVEAFQVVCYDNGKMTYVIDVDRNNFNEPTAVYRSNDRKLAMAFCDADATDIEITLDGDGFLTDRIEVQDTEPLYRVIDLNGTGIGAWTQKSPVTFKRLVGYFYGLTFGDESFEEDISWEDDFLSKGKEILVSIEHYWNVRIEKVN